MINTRNEFRDDLTNISIAFLSQKIVVQEALIKFRTERLFISLIYWLNWLNVFSFLTLAD